MTTDIAMSIWTVFCNPADYPGKYVVRRFDIQRGNKEPVRTDDVNVYDSLDAARLPLHERGCVRLTRFDQDAPHIVETWV